MTFLIILKCKFPEKSIPDINLNLRAIRKVLIINKEESIPEAFCP